MMAKDHNHNLIKPFNRLRFEQLEFGYFASLGILRDLSFRKLVCTL